MKALISPHEAGQIKYISEWIQVDGKWEAQYVETEDGQRIAEVSESEFDVAEPLFWVDCPADCTPDIWYYKNGECIKIPDHAVMPQ